MALLYKVLGDTTTLELIHTCTPPLILRAIQKNSRDASDLSGRTRKKTSRGKPLSARVG